MRESIRPVAGAITLLALMGVRCLCPHNMIGLVGPVVNQAWKLRSVPLCHQCLPRSLHRVGGDPVNRRSRSADGIALLPRQQRPCDARRLIGKRYERLIEPAALNDSLQPERATVTTLREPADDSAGAVDHLPAQIMVCPATDAAEARLA